MTSSLLLAALALADDSAVTPAAPVAVPSPIVVATDPRALRLAGFVDAPSVSFTPKLDFKVIEHRFRVADGDGLLTVEDTARRVGDVDVRAKRKRQATVGAIVGSLGLAVGATMLAVHSVDEIGDDPVYSPLTAITGVAGAVTGIGALGSVLQTNERPWLYWTAAVLAPKLDAWNLANVGPGVTPAMPAATEPAPELTPTAPATILAPFEPKPDPNAPF
ncbi:MAG: hypothetical protein EXR71_03930 [Myxococcales bacterium]|nr:hypothetical protein [Myxococcales bacterium]